MRQGRSTPGRPSPADSPSGTGTAGGLLAACAVAAALRAAVLWSLHGHPLLQPGFGLDTDLYVELAGRVAAGDLLLAPGAYPAAPLYAYVLGGVLALSGGSLLAARLLQILLGVAAVWLTGDAARRVYGPSAAVPAALLAALCGPLAFNEVLILQSSLDPFLTASALWALARAGGGRSRASWLGAGALWAAVVLNRPNALPFAVGVPAALLWRHGPSGGLKPVAAYLLGLALLLAPVAMRNAWATGDVVLVASHGGFNFFVGNNADADGTYGTVAGVTPSSVRQAADARRVAEAALGRPLSDGEVSDYFYQEARAWIAAAPYEAAALLLQKIRYVLSADEIALNYSFAYYRHDEQSALALMPAGPWLLLPLGLVGLVACAPRGDTGYWTWAAFVPVYAISVAIFFVSDRYRLPLLVPLAASSGAMMARALALARAGAWHRLLAGAGAVSVAAALTWWPTGLDDGRQEERTAMAEWLLRQGAVDAGQALVDRLRPDHRQPAMLLFRAGRALQAAGRCEPAIARYRQALDLEPTRAEIRYALGQCLVDAGRAGEAAAHLDAAVRAGVRPDVAPFDLARALAAAGSPGAARAALARLAIPARADTRSFVRAGQLAERLEDVPLAITFYAGVATRPDVEVPVLERLGVLLAMSGRAREAAAVLDRAVSRSPHEPSLHLNLAVALAQDGRLEEARASAGRALRLRPDYPQARALLDTLR